MKKIIIFTLFIFICVISQIIAAEDTKIKFSDALETCQKYSQLGGTSYENQYFNIQINLEKNKNKCQYREKIFQGKKFQMLTCNFDMGLLPNLSNSMRKYENTFKNEIAKNKIFEAKMTTNGEIFQNYLIDPAYCHITHSN